MVVSVKQLYKKRLKNLKGGLRCFYKTGVPKMGYTKIFNNSASWSGKIILSRKINKIYSFIVSPECT